MLLGDLSYLGGDWRFELESSPLDGRTVDEVITTWWDDRPSDLRERSDGIDALRARLALAAAPNGAGGTWSVRGPDWWTTLVREQLGPIVERATHPQLVGSVLDGQIAKWLTADVAGQCLIGLGMTLSAVPWERFGTLPQLIETDDTTFNDREWRHEIGSLLWSRVLHDCHQTHPEAFGEDLFKAWWQLLRFVDEPFVGVRRSPPQQAVILHAHAVGIAEDADVYDLLMWRRDLLDAWTRRRPGPLADRYPAAAALAMRLRDRVVEIERRRGELPTEATPYVRHIQHIEGAALALDLLERMGSSVLVRNRWVFTDRDAVYSHLIQVSHPAPGEGAASLVAAAETVGLPKGRLIELAMYAPQWADLVEEALGWTGLADAVWWYHAHTKDDRWYVQAEVRDRWAAQSAERTALSAGDLYRGAVDVDWFRRARRRLGPKRWQELHDLAALASRGTGHVRAKQFVDAMLGRLDEVAVTARVTNKRHQDSVRSLGLLPLPKGQAARQAKVLAPYAVVREFERGSRRFGSQRRESEGTAVTVGIDNLARTAGYADPLRFSWAMEAAEAGDLADGPVTVVVDDVTVVLSVDREGTPELVVNRRSKRLAAVPAKLRKEPAIAGLRERKTQLMRQASRVRHALEGAMIDAERFDAADLAALDRHPVVAPMLELLVFVDEAGLTARRVRGGAFRSATGEDVRPTGPVRSGPRTPSTS